jgi:hypothetical protein
MNVQLDSDIFDLVRSVDSDVTKVVHEALTLWLKERLITCPITHQFCVNPNCPCNDCALTKNSSKKR